MPYRTQELISFDPRSIFLLLKGHISKEDAYRLVDEVWESNPRSEGGSTLSIDRSHPFNPVEFIGRGWSIIEQNERSLAITEVELAKVSLVTMLKNYDNGRVHGEEKLHRLKASGHIRLDAKIFQTFWENKDRIPEIWRGKCVYFDGTVLQSPSGCRYVLYLDWRGDEWDWHYYWLESDWGDSSPSAVLAE